MKSRRSATMLRRDLSLVIVCIVGEVACSPGKTAGPVPSDTKAQPANPSSSIGSVIRTDLLDPAVQRLRQSSPAGFPEVTIGPAFDSTFDSGRWESLKTSKGATVVEFTGRLKRSATQERVDKESAAHNACMATFSATLGQARKRVEADRAQSIAAENNTQGTAFVTFFRRYASQFIPENSNYPMGSYDEWCDLDSDASFLKECLPDPPNEPAYNTKRRLVANVRAVYARYKALGPEGRRAKIEELAAQQLAALNETRPDCPTEPNPDAWNTVRFQWALHANDSGHDLVYIDFEPWSHVSVFLGSKEAIERYVYRGQ